MTLIQFVLIVVAILLGAQLNAWATVGINYALESRRQKRMRADLARVLSGQAVALGVDACPCPNCVGRRAATRTAAAGGPN